MSKHHPFRNARRVASVAAAMAMCSACAAPDLAPTPAAATQSVNLPGAGRQNDASDYRAAWATQIIGRPVIDSEGQHLGKLLDLVVEMSTGRMRYAVVSTMHGPGERLVAVPVGLLRQTEQDTVFLAMAGERFARQKSWPAANWPSLDDSSLWAEIDRLAGVAGSPAGASDGYRLSRLVETDVDNLQGRHLGRIIDVVIDMAAQAVHYAVLAYDRRVGAATEHAFAVPITSLGVRSGGERLALDVEHARLARLIGSDPAAWKPIDGPRYIGTVDRTYERLPPHGAVGASR